MLQFEQLLRQMQFISTFFANYDNSRTKVIGKEELLENDGMSVFYSV